MTTVVVTPPEHWFTPAMSPQTHSCRPPSERAEEKKPKYVFLRLVFSNLSAIPPSLLPCPLFLSALILGVGIPFEQASLCITCGRQLDSEDGKKKNKEKKKKEERASEGGNVSGVFRAPDDAILSRNTASAPPMAAHAWADARRVSTATPNLPQHQSFPSHNPPPPPPPSLSISLLFHPPLLCLGINVKQLINTAVHEEAVPNDRHSWSICQDSPTHSYRRKAVTHSRIHTDMLNKADYTLPMIDVTSVEDSFVYFVLSPREHSTLQASG